MDDTKDTKDIKETGEAASVLSVDEQMIQDGFNALLNDYLKSNHRRKVERITKAFNFAKSSASFKSCTSPRITPRFNNNFAFNTCANCFDK